MKYPHCRHCLYRPKGANKGELSCMDALNEGHDYPCMSCAVADER